MEDKVNVQELDLTTQHLLTGLFKDWQFSRFGNNGTTLPVEYKTGADNLKQLAIRPDDVVVVTFPRSGTTVTQELVWLLKNDLDYDAAAKTSLRDRYTFLEIKYVRQKPLEPSLVPVVSDLARTAPSLAALAAAPSPRFLKSHLPLSLLPPLLDSAKVVYVARDPRDVAVSYYYFSKHFFNYTGDFKTYWNLFKNDLVPYSPFFPHVKEAWALRHHQNLLFIFYEDMTRDMTSTINRVASFLGKEVTNEEIVKLCEHLHIDTFRHNTAVNLSFITDNLGDPKAFIRNGKSGAWQSEFDEETAAQAQRWLREKLADTDLRFPTHDQHAE